MSGIGVVHNPFARKNLKDPLLAHKLRVILGDQGELFVTQNPGQLESVARVFMEKELEVLGVNGGDGSLHHVLTAFVKVFASKEKTLPRLVVLRGGTMNTVAASLKLKGGPEDILARLVKSRMSGRGLKVFPQQLLRVNDKYGFIAGCGVIPRFLDSYYSGARTGPVKAVEMVSKLVLSAILRTRYAGDMFREEPMGVWADGKDLGRKSYKAVLASTVKEVGLGFSLTHRANEKPGCLHLIASSISPIPILLRLLPFWLGRDVRHPDLYYHGPAGEVVIRPGGELRWMMDGDIYTTKSPLRLSIGPVVDIVRV